MAAIDPQTGQQVVIARVLFNAANDTAAVTFRATDEAFNFAPTQQLCTGAEDAECLNVQDLVDEGALPDELAVGTDVTVTLEGVTPEGGEIVLASNVPSEAAAFVFAYVVWGAEFNGDAPTVGGGESWEARAAGDGFWILDERIDPDGTQNAIILGGNAGNADNGDTSLAAGFGVCTADEL